jgi:CheY-like chemotaxis protein
LWERPDTPVTSERTLPILVVDDDEPTRNLVQAVLRRVGYASENAANGSEAIALLERNDYAAIVLDLMMPSVSGRDVVDFLAVSGRGIPVIICSAAGPAALADFDPGIVKAVIRKPFDIEQFAAAITAVTRRPE